MKAAIKIQKEGFSSNLEIGVVVVICADLGSSHCNSSSSIIWDISRVTGIAVSGSTGLPSSASASINSSKYSSTVMPRSRAWILARASNRFGSLSDCFHVKISPNWGRRSGLLLKLVLNSSSLVRSRSLSDSQLS
jgi:hypothetical protein